MNVMSKTVTAWTSKVQSIDQLEEIYGEPNPDSLAKEIDYISEDYQKFIEAAPFVVLATVGEEGLDCSPRGDPPGFVRVHDRKTVLMPDRKGNNRLDSLRNLVCEPRCSLLFLIPGVGETMRINGTAELVTDHALLESFSIQGKLPTLIVVVHVDRIYFQCPKALVRSRLWDPEVQVPRADLPTAGQILRGLSDDDFDDKAYDKAYPEHLKKTIY